MDMIDIGHRLREMRQEKKLTQKQLADILETVHPVISRAENGEQQLSASLMQKLSINLNISLDWLLTGRGKMYLSSSPETGNEKLDNLCRLLKENPEMISITEGFVRGSVSVKELLEAIDSLPEKKRRVALIQVRALAEC